MEIRTQSETGPVVPPLAEITATLSRQINDRAQPLLDRLNQDPARFAQIEVEIHDRFRHLADQMTASLWAAATISPTPGPSPRRRGIWRSTDATRPGDATAEAPAPGRSGPLDRHDL